MTETTTILTQPKPVPVPLLPANPSPANPSPANPSPTHPSEVMLSLVAALLAPMFLCVSGGDIDLARSAAIETVNAYRVRNQAGLLAVAQIVAFGLTALGSLSLSMADELSLSMTLRLRANANALNRSAEQNRRALDKFGIERMSPESDPEMFTPEMFMDEEDHRQEALAIASVAAAQQAAAARLRTPAEAKAAVQSPIPAPVAPRPAQPVAAAKMPASPIPAPPMPAPSMPAPLRESEQDLRAQWAAAIADVAGEFTASLPHLPPAERKIASRKAAVMSSSVTAILSGETLPRLQPGALAAMMRPTR